MAARTFIDKDFLLTNDAARELYHTYAASLPIVDYHNHIDPRAIASDKCYEDMGELWVVSDPYKHRAMRIYGIPENRISGNAGRRNKFDAWAEACPYTMGNPLYHWSALELQRVFGIDELLCPDNASSVWERCNNLLRQEEYSTIGILRKWQVELLCTSDDLLDDVSVHQRASLAAGFSVLPSLRADSILAMAAGWLNRLSDVPVKSLDDYLQAVSIRLDAFDAAGCRLADHALDNGFRFALPAKAKAERIFAGLLQGGECTGDDNVQLRSYLLYWLACEYARRGWVMQLHLGAERFTSSRLRRLAGPAGGYATIGNNVGVRSLCDLLDRLEMDASLPRTILYSLNPADHAVLATLTGSFIEDGVGSRLQCGPAWWYNDHQEGIEQCLRAISSYGLLSRFIGMTTDSRSILSFSRHEYFRRILCNYIGRLIESRELPDDMQWGGRMVQDISYKKAKKWCFNK